MCIKLLIMAYIIVTVSFNIFSMYIPQIRYKYAGKHTASCMYFYQWPLDVGMVGDFMY